MRGVFSMTKSGSVWIFIFILWGFENLIPVNIPSIGHKILCCEVIIVAKARPVWDRIVIGVDKSAHNIDAVSRWINWSVGWKSNEVNSIKQQEPQRTWLDRNETKFKLGREKPFFRGDVNIVRVEEAIQVALRFTSLYEEDNSLPLNIIRGSLSNILNKILRIETAPIPRSTLCYWSGNTKIGSQLFIRGSSCHFQSFFSRGGLIPSPINRESRRQESEQRDVESSFFVLESGPVAFLCSLALFAYGLFRIFEAILEQHGPQYLAAAALVFLICCALGYYFYSCAETSMKFHKNHRGSHTIERSDVGTVA